MRVNDALSEMNGIPPKDHIGRTNAEMVPDLAAKVEGTLREVLANGKPTSPVELSGTTAATEGESRHWLASYYPVDVAGGRGLGCVVLDVTDRRLATERLRRSEQRYRTLVETTQDLVWTVGSD